MLFLEMSGFFRMEIVFKPKPQGEYMCSYIMIDNESAIDSE